ncbi:MAG: hypothetical protein ACOZCL_09345 [Bacillota bacterium]
MELNETVIIPIIIAAVELMKGLGLPKKFSAIVSLFLGVLAGILYFNNDDIKRGILNGIIFGLTASGLYSGTKNTVQYMKLRK